MPLAPGQQVLKLKHINPERELRRDADGIPIGLEPRFAELFAQDRQYPAQIGPSLLVSMLRPKKGGQGFPAVELGI